ncbi:hypothetical protein [Rossellomorea sp. SC111]|uniref:hypothetical protein n=1 Tax=Rossellomorea sp. SC111 TaxID=2968985 RepID=UPI00215A5CFA|nr:hypothetical protein [Rossellomorea sp. SC111]
MIFIQVFHVKMLYSGAYVKIQNGKSPFTILSIVAFSTLGYVAAQFLMSYMLTDSAYMIVLMMAYTVVSIVTAYLSTFVHRYIYIRKYNEKVLKMYPDLGKPKDSRKFG